MIRYSDTAIARGSKAPNQPSDGVASTRVAPGLPCLRTSCAYAAPPTITASAFPPPNASGWNTTSVYVTFTCTAGGFPIATCPAQQVVSTDGASQIITGTATDTSGGTASASVTLNVERTPPALAISSPADQDSFTSATLSVAGTASNSVTNINSVSCNGTTAATSAGAFSCNLSLNPGVNLVMVRATDVAGNISAVRLHVTYAAALPAPASLQIGPASANVLVGATQQFTAVDEFGRPRTDATWTVDNAGIATITTDASPTLTGVAAGTVTLTASVGSATTQIQVNVLAGTSLPVGTVLWIAPSTPGFAVVQIAQAVPTANGPDLFSIESGSFTTSQVRALTSDGRPMWTAPISGNTARGLSATPDGSGGLLVHLSPQTGVGTLMDIDGQSGAVVWQRADSSTASGTKGTIGQDGTIYVADATFSTTVTPGSTVEQVSLLGFNPDSGATTFAYPVPFSTLTNGASTTVPDYRVGPVSGVSQPIIGPDGSLFAEVLVVHRADPAYNQTLSLLQSVPGGATTLSTIAEVDHSGSGPTPFVSPVGQIPDGSGGTYASWYTVAFPGNALVNHISHITSTGVIDSTPSFQGPILPDGMVDGESSTLFATDGLSVTSFSSSLSPNWSYIAPSQNGISIIAAMAGSGLAITLTDFSSQPNPLEISVSLDSNGNPTQLTQVGAPTAPAYSWKGTWNGLTSSSTVSRFVLPLFQDFASIWATPAGHPSAGNTAGALCDCLTETTDPDPAPPSTLCPICNLPQPDPLNNPTSCTAPTGGQPTFVLLVADPGINTPGGRQLDTGHLFGLAAQTQANSLQAQGHNVIACRVSSIQDFYSAIAKPASVDGGVYYFGHSGTRQIIESGQITRETSELFVGQNEGDDTNVSAKNVRFLHDLQTANSGQNIFGSNASLTVNGCEAGLTIFDATYNGFISIAQLISTNIARGVYAYEVGLYFSQLDAQHDQHITGGNRKASEAIPTYMVPTGAPGHKPAPKAFCPSGICRSN